jgi:hypothetical protein
MFGEGKYTAFDTSPSKRGTPGRWPGSQDRGLALPGSNQARKGRLVDALAVRGDEGRDTLR